MITDDVIKAIDRETQGFCVYPQGYNADCVDCANCRRAFLAHVRQVLNKGGSARLLIIDDGELKDDKELHKQTRTH